MTGFDFLFLLLAVLLGAALAYGLSRRAQDVLRALQAKQLAEAEQAQAALRATLAEAQAALGREQAARVVAEREQAVLATRLAAAEPLLVERERLQAELRSVEAKWAALTAERDTMQREMAEKLKIQAQSRDDLQVVFRDLAQRVLEEKGLSFSEQNRQQVDQLLTPLREQLKGFRERVDHVYDTEARERHALKQEIFNLRELNQRINDEAIALTRALKGEKKAQGNWGEVVLARVLEESGLREGHEYEVQVAQRDDEGRLKQPDVIVHLPEGRDIVIDSKVSLVDYERYVNADDERERQQAINAHIAALRTHVRGLSEKRYQDLPGVRTLDFVFIFLPIEAAFMAAVEHDPTLFREAFERHIIIVSPTTLLASLRTVESIWRYERQNRNADQIALEAGKLYDKLATALEHLELLERALTRAQDAYRKSMSSLTGQGGLASKVEKLRELGAKARKHLPASSEDEAPELLVATDSEGEGP